MTTTSILALKTKASCTSATRDLFSRATTAPTRAVNPDSKKYQLAPRQRGDAAAGERGDNSIDQWVAAVKKRGPAPATNYALQTGPTESILLGGLAQRFIGEKLEWDSANMRVTNLVEKANAYMNPPYRGGYTV